jgi:hypothetical protein
MLEHEEAAFVFGAEGSVPAEPVRADDAMAGDEDAEAVLRAERAGGTCGAGPTGESRELAVRDDVASGNVAERLHESLPVRRQVAEIQLDVREVVLGAGEVRA